MFVYHKIAAVFIVYFVSVRADAVSAVLLFATLNSYYLMPVDRRD